MGYQRITASVGKHSGGKQCYNYPADQAVVQDLLNAIPAWQGGQEGRLKDPIAPGVVSPSLHWAIDNFQWQQGLSRDGHIDPNGAAIKRLNLLASGAPPMPEPPKRERVKSSDPPPLEFSEMASNGPPVSRTQRGGPIPLKEVVSGFVPAVKSFQGGSVITFQLENRSASSVTVTVSMVSAVATHTNTTTVPRFKSYTGPQWRHNVDPPIGWTVNVSLTGGAAGVVMFSVRTNWRPGDPV